MSPVNLMFSGLKTILHSVSNVFQETSQSVLQYDFLKFPMAVADSLPQETNVDIQNVERIILEDIDGEILDLTSSSDNITDQTIGFIKNSRSSLIQYYKDYYAKYPNLRQLIIGNVKEKISKHFQMDIDPDKVQFVSIDNITHQEKEKIHFSQQFENKTLAEWFFTNFNRNIEINVQNVNALIKLDNTKTMNLFKLLKLVDKVNFYDDIKRSLIKSFQDKEMHIKKYFIDFVCHLDISGINNKSVKDVLNGVGLIPGRAVYTSLLDINGYVASTAFCFRNEDGRLTFYFPESAFKFISFKNKAEMRQWLFFACSKEYQLNMIASHFENWHNNALYSEIAKWLNVTRQDAKIATGRVYIPSHHFFEYLFNQIRDKTIFNFVATMKLDTTSRRNMWKKTMNVANKISDLIPLFLSLHIHLNRIVEADTYRKKSKEWCAMKDSAINTITMPMLDKIMKFPHKGGYYFIDTVINGIETVDMKRLKLIPDNGLIRKHNFFQFGKSYLTEYYEDYNSKYLGLNMLARSVLKEKIQERFKLQLDPDKVRFVLFNGVVYAEEKKHYIVAGIRLNQTLKACLFTNFDSQVRNNLPDMDAMGGLYESSVWSKKVLRASDEVKIKPTDFIKLVDDIDFYNYAKDKLTESFKDKDAHIKKYFFDFVTHLSDSQINEEAVKDVQVGVGIGKGRKIRVSLFDINKYPAANAFVFRNQNSRVTLYFPGSDFKFMSFRTETEMRSWVINACSTKEHRAMIASHFTIKNRQDGTFYYGVDAWLDSIKESKYYDRVAGAPRDINSEYFFGHLFDLIKDKTFSDLDSLVKSNAEVRRDMWEEMIDASNIIPNPISPFLSLAFHLEHAIEADTYEEKMQEWNKIKSDAVDFFVMMIFMKIMSFPDKQGVEVGDINHAMGIAEMHPSAIFDPNLPTWSWLDSQISYRESQITYGITNFMATIESFLPLREIQFNTDIRAVEGIISQYIVAYYKETPFDIFYGFKDIPNDPVPLYINQARIKVRKHLNILKENLRDIYNRIHDDDYKNEVRRFLSLLVDSRDQRIVDQTYSRLQIMVKRAIDYLEISGTVDYMNIGIVSTRQVPVLDRPFLYESAITNAQDIENFPFGFTNIEDPFRRLYIILDRMIYPHEKYNIFYDKNAAVYDTLAHETSHISSSTQDVFYLQYNEKKSMLENVALAQISFESALSSNVENVPQFRKFIALMKQYFGWHEGISEVDIIYKMKNDPMLKANIMMENADTFVLCIKEIARMSLQQRAKREDKDISDDSINSYLALVFYAIQNHYTNTQIECK